MSERETGGSAFPHDGFCRDGMMLRDYFAAKALNGLLSNKLSMQNMIAKKIESPEEAAKEWAYSAYKIADAMLAERNK